MGCHSYAKHVHHLIAPVIDDLYGDTTFFGLSKGLAESAVFARRTPEPDLCIARQRINRLLTKTADP
jgi:hypothetical protein